MSSVKKNSNYREEALEAKIARSKIFYKTRETGTIIFASRKEMNIEPHS
jgi:hypothetical protein